EPVCGQAHYFAGVEQDSARMAKSARKQQLRVEPFPKLVPPAEIGVQGPVWMKKIGTTMDPAKMSCRRSREAIHGIDVGQIKGLGLLAQRTPQRQGQLVLARLDPAREVGDLDAFFEDRLAEGKVRQPFSFTFVGLVV